ncbi:HD family phosphohydrolase [Rhodopirellula sallentina]|uniref:HDIG-domain-containing protein n=1 Tax=Rhodopirellula sallentina SM41 TaxID=1263870 RepID=M5UL45_9BACT|nr:HDIG domain-containing metalloprotein [Rhodopirellula sallentina]EMI56718.1 HDIG-domain-containing protein [Rhodopirellula sallentina SM41]
MSNAKTQRAGKERIESLGIPKPKWATWWDKSDKGNLAIRFGFALIAAIAVLALCRTWQPAFSYRMGAIPARDLMSRVTFQVPDRVATDDQRERKRREVLTLYRNTPGRLEQLRAALRNRLFLVLGASSFEQLGEKEKEALTEFYEGSETLSDDESPAERFALLKRVFAKDVELTELDSVVESAMMPLYRNGVLQAPQHSPEQGSQRMIRVFQGDQVDEAVPVELSKVRIAEAAGELRTKLKENFRTRYPSDEGQVAAEMIAKWLRDQLPNYETLKYDDDLSQKARDQAADAVETVQMTYYAGQSKLADAGKPLSVRELELLRSEWSVLVDEMQPFDRIARVAAFAGMIIALYLLCGSYVWFVDDRTLVTDHWKLAKVLTLVVATIVLSYYASRDAWRAELVPLVLASIIAAVVYGRDFALLVMAGASLSVTLLLGADLSNLVVMAAACTSCALLTGRIRSRTHLITVGILSALITMATTIGVGIVSGQTLSSGAPGDSLEPMLLSGPLQRVLSGLVGEAGWAGLCILVSSLAMTGLLPLVEKAFGVQTDLSLLELGDASHPLLRRLAQRAPGTYNHSINVASIAEAAADSIGANGLLVRVGAYFHDIGKMFKPEYFIENQSAGINQHDSLQPAMSTLVIIAHVKDGADLARNHHLPRPIIDFILQHHGTTLVEYFYREAAKRSEEDPNRESVSDKDFRYPGPKPQTLEAAVLMLADTVESASRTLVDPTPARISNLVDAIAQKKVSDGQFDECGLTFSQLHRVRQSLVKSLTAIYHARVKYPGQQSA